MYKMIEIKKSFFVSVIENFFKREIFIWCMKKVSALVLSALWRVSSYENLTVINQNMDQQNITIVAHIQFNRYTYCIYITIFL